MKKLYFFAFTFLFYAYGFGQCDQAEPLCFINPTASFQSNVTSNIPEPGIDYGCLVTVGAVKWCSLDVIAGGTFNIHGYAEYLDGNEMDLDYILYGPFDTPTCGSGLSEDKIISRSFASQFTIDINTTLQTGKYYMLALTCFSPMPGVFVLSQNDQANAAILDCGDTDWCNVNLETVVYPCENDPMGAYLVATSSADFATFQWTLNGVALPDTTNFVQGYGPGVYTVTATYNSCLTTETAIVPEAPNFAAGSAPDIPVCNSPTVDLAQSEMFIIGGQDPVNFSINYHLTESDAYDVANPITNPNAYFVDDDLTIFYSVENLVSGSPCVEVGSFEVDLNAGPNMVSFVITDQMAEIYATGNNLTYSANGGPFVSTNVFTDLPLGTNQVTAQNDCGSETVTFEITNPSAPTGDITQTFTPGATLANIVVNGQSILWYADSSADKSVSDTPLPLSTILTDGTTYYASQTINGIESTQRLGVTVSLQLATDSQTFVNLSVEPNPVKGKLAFRNATEIDTVRIYTLSGRLLFERNVNVLSGDIDFTDFASGIYFVTFHSGESFRTVRIVK